MIGCCRHFLYFHYSKYFCFHYWFFCFFTSQVYKSGNDRKLICSRCGESSKENNPLNQVGSKYNDDQNEIHTLKTILEQALVLKLSNLASTIAENLQNKTPAFIYLSCRDYLRNKSRPRKGSIEHAQQISVKRVARRSNPGLFGFKSQYFYCEKPCTDDKKQCDRKNFEIVSTINAKTYTSTLEIFRDREDIVPKTLKDDYLQ